MVDLKSQYHEIKPEIDQAIQNVIDSTAFINGQAVREFASNLAAWNKTKYVVPCANGTDGLQIAMMALDLSPGDEVIVPAFTYIATVEVIALLGLKPVFVDVDPRTFNINLSGAEKKINIKTKAIVPVHLYGQCAEMDALLAFAKKHKLFVIEDLAQAIGSEYKGSRTGNMGDIGVTSFFPSKNLGCFGDGGAIFTNDDELAGKIQMIANHGQSKKYYHDAIGLNSRLDTLQAAILNEKLKHLDGYIENRRNVAKQYDELLENLTGKLEIPYRSAGTTHVFHQYTVKVALERDQLKSFLSKKGIPSMIYYPLPIPKQKAYQKYTSDSFPVSEQLANQVLSLPMHTHLISSDIAFICDTIKSFFHE